MIALFFVATASPWVPDEGLTPGARSDAVTQDNIKTTVCVAGYTSTVRHVTQAMKRAVVKAYRAKHADWPAGPFEIDHRLDLAAGGANDVTNLWPQPIADARLKDVVETRLHRDLCAGRITLAQAQAIALGDWRVCYDHIKKKEPCAESE